MAILSNEYFQQRFGGDRSVIGKPLPVAAAFGPPPIIVGVLAPGFELLFPPKANMEQFPSLWIAARIPYDVANRNNVQWRVIGRLKPGVTIGASAGRSRNHRPKNSRRKHYRKDSRSIFPTCADEAAPCRRSSTRDSRAHGCGHFPATDCVCECGEPDVGESFVARTRAGGSGRAGRWLVAVSSANTRRGVRDSRSRNGHRGWACLFRYSPTAL